MSREKSTESLLQWLAIVITSLGLLLSIYYNSNILKATRIENEVASYLNLNERYHKLLFTLLQNDAEIFKKKDHHDLNANKYLIYELFELLATVNSLQACYKELGKDVWLDWSRRVDFLFSKPAIRAAWLQHQSYARKIYREEFIVLMQRAMAQNEESSPVSDSIK